MANIAFLGMGAMGSRMAFNLIKNGHNLTVWNRNMARTSTLADVGAAGAESPREAADGADFVISMLRDNEASKKVWCDEENGALSGMKSNAIALECSTLTIEWVRKLNQRCAKKGIVFLDAPVAGSRPQAESAQLIFFVGGEKKGFDRVETILKSMGNTAHYAGNTGAGACVKLAVNTLFGVQLATMAELINMFKTSGVDITNAVDILTSTPVCSVAAKLSANAMLAENFTPMFPIELVEKDFSYAVSFVEKNGLSAPVTNATWAVYQQAIEKGFGYDNITGIGQLYY